MEIEQQFDEPIESLLRRLYYDDELGVKAIAKLLGVSDRNLWDWLEDLGIERRDRSTAVGIQWKDNVIRRKNQSETMKEEFGTGKRDSSFLVRFAKSDWGRKRNSESKMGDKNPMYNRIGASSPFWKGGKVTYRGKGWRSIRKQIIRRDNNQCRRCDSKKDLQVHHIVPYRETQDNSPGNLVTLCLPCHIEVEHHNATWD